MEHIHNTEIRELKIDDDVNDENNLIRIKEYPESETGTGCIVWECAIILGKYAVKQNYNDNRFTDKVILELGSGTGILALMFAHLGNTIFATDTEETMGIISENVKENVAVFKGKGSIKTFVLDWNFNKTSIKDALIKEDIQKIDYIIASDVIFNKKHLAIFPTALQNIVLSLKEINPDASPPVVYISHKARNPEIDDLLPETFENLGFFGEQIDETDMDPQHISKRIDIFRLNFEGNCN